MKRPRVRLVDVSPLRESAPFARLWAAGAVVQVAAQSAQAALAWWIFQESGTSLAVGLLGVAVGVPVVALSLVGGALADSRSPKNVALAGVLAQLACAIVFFVSTVSGILSVWLTFCLVAVSSAGGAIAAPTRRPYLRRLLRKEAIPAAASLYMISMHVGQIVGPIVGGLMVASSLGLGAVFGAQIGAMGIYLYAVLSLPPLGPAGASGRITAGIWDGLKYVRDRPVIRACIGIDLYLTFFVVPTVLFPELVERHWGMGPEAYGYLLAAVSIGGVAVTLFAGTFTSMCRLGRGLLIASGVWVLAVVLLAASPSFEVALLLAAVIGGADVVTLTLQQAIVQLAVGDEMQGRVGALQMLVGMGGPQLGGARAGAFGSLLGPVGALVAGVPFAIALIALDKRGLRAVAGFERGHGG